MQVVPGANVGVLERIGVAVDRASLRAPETRDETKPRERGLLGEQLILREVAQTIELPPGRLGFAPVPVQDVRQQPPRLLPRATVRALRRHVGQKGGRQRRNARGALIDLLRCRAILGRRARDRDAAGLHGGPQTLQPVAEMPRGDAIVPVVALD